MVSASTGSQSATTSRLTPSRFELHIGRGWLTSERSLVKHINQNDANGYYMTLRLPPSASKDEIKAAYWELAKGLHPDRGGDEELFRFLSDVASALLDPKSKSVYDSVGNDAIYLGNMEREELARRGMLKGLQTSEDGSVQKPHWACLTDHGSTPGEDTDAWVSLCREVSPAVGYRGKMLVGVVEGGYSWPCDPRLSWGVLDVGVYTFVVFQRGVEPNRLHALCAMIDLQNQTRQ